MTVADEAEADEACRSNTVFLNFGGDLEIINLGVSERGAKVTGSGTMMAGNLELPGTINRAPTKATISASFQTR